MKNTKTLHVIWCILCGIIVAALFKLFIIESMVVKGISMTPTLKDGQVIYVNKTAYGIPDPFGAKLLVQWKEPSENDIIIFLYNNNINVKRCVAVENATLDYLTESRYILMVNLDRQIPLTAEQYEKLKNCSTVPSGYILAVGDNYDESFDSRDYGFIPVSNVLGKVICR